MRRLSVPETGTHNNNKKTCGPQLTAACEPTKVNQHLNLVISAAAGRAKKTKIEVDAHLSCGRSIQSSLLVDQTKGRVSCVSWTGRKCERFTPRLLKYFPRAGCAPSTTATCYRMSKPSARRHSLCASMNLAHSSSPFMMTQSSLACGKV